MGLSKKGLFSIKRKDIIPCKFTLFLNFYYFIHFILIGFFNIQVRHPYDLLGGMESHVYGTLYEIATFQIDS